MIALHARMLPPTKFSVVIALYTISQQRTKMEEIKVKKKQHNFLKKKKSGCLLNFKLPFLKLNTGNLDLPAQTLTG